MRGGLLGGRSVFLSITHSITYFLQNHRGSILAECSSGGSEAFPMFVRECGDTHSRHFPCFVRDRTARVKECRRLASGGGGARVDKKSAVAAVTGSLYIGGSGARVDKKSAVAAVTGGLYIGGSGARVDKKSAVAAVTGVCAVTGAM